MEWVCGRDKGDEWYVVCGRGEGDEWQRRPDTVELYKLKLPQQTSSLDFSEVGPSFQIKIQKVFYLTISKTN